MCLQKYPDIIHFKKAIYYIFIFKLTRLTTNTLIVIRISWGIKKNLSFKVIVTQLYIV